MQPANHDLSLSAAAATLAHVSFHMTEHAYKGPFDSSGASSAQSSPDRDTCEAPLAGWRRLDLRDREVTRGRALCIGMSAGMITIAPMVERRSDSPRTDRPHQLQGSADANRHAYLLAVVMLSGGVET